MDAQAPRPLEKNGAVCTWLLLLFGPAGGSRVAPPLQDKLERVLDLSRQQVEQYREQLGHSQKVAYQQRLLQEDLVAIRAQISRVSTVTPIRLMD